MLDVQEFQKKLGRKISNLRRSKSLSQAELAKSVGISRPSLAQIELGNRGMAILELKEFARVLSYSIDAFLSDESEEISLVEEETSTYTLKNTVRISTPEFNPSKFKTVLLYILETCAGKPQIDEQMLNLLLYFCDFNYYEIYEEQLTGADYRKSSQGPMFMKFNSITNQMIKKGEILRIKSSFNGKLCLKLLALIKADLTKLTAAEISVINQVLLQMGNWNSEMLLKYAGRDIPCMATSDGETIRYNLAFYRELPYSVRVYDE